TKTREELGWKPKYTDFETGLKDTIKWYEDNREWWQQEKVEVETKYAQNNQ
ncbi:dTDP-glucose 4,6-dehydratase, partial [Weissella cibaria]|nr:dTDP-glucose 4,6-dehydratase [Weissella cibaria]